MVECNPIDHQPPDADDHGVRVDDGITANMDMTRACYSVGQQAYEAWGRFLEYRDMVTGQANQATTRRQSRFVPD